MRKAIMIKRGSPKALVVLMLILMAKSTDLTQLAQNPAASATMLNFALRELQQTWKELLFTLEREYAGRNYLTLVSLPYTGFPTPEPHHHLPSLRTAFHRREASFQLQGLHSRHQMVVEPTDHRLKIQHLQEPAVDRVLILSIAWDHGGLFSSIISYAFPVSHEASSPFHSQSLK
ncbi:hypothetical protein L596_028911 [Steinernema carpocapsae]|uniref:Uncharacterized protein n=1 Tax=Steinernema carpocapsae TaxID=34508 RepID=A0A4U5LZU3_STECR|nr:hypothetical protein L596_028911 [Steinernema carpocapsae]